MFKSMFTCLTKTILAILLVSRKANPKEKSIIYNNNSINKMLSRAHSKNTTPRINN